MSPPDALTMHQRDLLQREMYRARSEEARLLAEATAKDERIRMLEKAVDDISQVAFDGPRKVKGAPGGEGYLQWQERIRSETKELRESLAKVSP